MHQYSTYPGLHARVYMLSWGDVCACLPIHMFPHKPMKKCTVFQYLLEPGASDLMIYLIRMMSFMPGIHGAEYLNTVTKPYKMTQTSEARNE